MKTLITLIMLTLPALADEPAPAIALLQGACGADSVKFSVTAIENGQPAPPPESGKAQVVVVEDYRRPGNEIGKPTVRVGLDGAWIGANRSTSHLSFSVAPGAHHLCADWQSLPALLHVDKSLANLTAEAGQTYYFRARLTEHSLSLWTLDLEQVNPDEGQLLVLQSPLSDYHLKK